MFSIIISPYNTTVMTLCEIMVTARVSGSTDSAGSSSDVVILMKIA
jgi:hypothetical protein